MKAKKYLKGGQVKLDANKDGKISGKDFSMLRKGMKKYQKGGKMAPTKKMKKADESEIDRRYGSTVGTNPRTGDLNYPNSSDMDKLDATAGTAGNPNNLRKAISDKYYSEQRKKMGIDKIKTYKSGGKVVKYQEGGSNPTPTERTYTEDDRRQMTSSGNQPGADYKGYNKTKTPKEVLEGSEMRRLKSALQKNNYGTNGMSLADMRKAAKTKGIYDDARKLARQDYLKEMDKRKG